MLRPQYSARDNAITQRPPSSAILAIDSEDRFKDYASKRANISTSSPYNFTIQKSESIMNGFFERLGVTEVVFPWTIPNIHDLCDTINISYGVSPGPYATAQITIDQGFYTPSELAAALETAIQAAAIPTFTMTYGTFTPAPGSVFPLPVFQYDTGAATQISFSPLPAGSLVNGKTIEPTTKQLFDVLGFSARNSGFETESWGNTTYAQSIRYIDIVCSQLTYNQSLRDTMSQQTARDTLCRLYISSDATPANVDATSSDFTPAGTVPFTINRQFATPKYIQWIPNQPVGGSLKFEVFDDTGRPLSDYTTAGNEIYQGTDWSMTLLVSEN
jgi:hypothetical protein